MMEPAGKIRRAKQGGPGKVHQTQRSDTNRIRDPYKTRGRSRYFVWFVWLVWLPLIPPIIIERFRSHPALSDLMISLTGVALFFGIYLWGSWRHVRRLLVDPAPPADRADWLITLILAVLSTVLTFVYAKEWGILFYFTSGDAGIRFPVARAITMIGALVVFVVSMEVVFRVDWFTIGQTVLFLCVIGGISIGIIRAITTSWQLHDAREELAHLAVTTERLRIARDLHDLLGHNLSLIVLKSELARRLVHVAPERAMAEIGDVEQAARSTLQEVREVVTSYRQPGLLNELHNAQELLAAAGIAYQYEGPARSEETLLAALEAVLAWTVREGVTNIVRHSHAHHCLIRMIREQHEVHLEIVNDGVALAQAEGTNSTDQGSKGGHGLRGLTERVEASGGRLEAGSLSQGGFRLSVAISLVERSDMQHVERSDMQHVERHAAGRSSGKPGISEERRERR